MRQNFFLLITFFFTLFQLFLVAQSYAIAIGSPVQRIPLPIRNINQTIFGEDQYYTVTFRGNGEAVVTMKAIVTNNSFTKPLSRIVLHMPPGISARDITAYEVTPNLPCIEYGPLTQLPQSQQNLNNQLNIFAKQPCIEYGQPDFHYVADNTTYNFISTQFTDNTLTLSLPNPIKQNDTGSYLLMYRSFNNTHKNIFGAYTFSFASLKVDDPIHSLQIGITTDSDLYLKDAKGTVQYTTPSLGMAALPKAADSGIQNTQLNDFYNQIGQGIITKTASNLAPMESYTVKGMYADAGIKLYGTEITLTILGILLLMLIIFSLALFFLKRGTKKEKEDKKINDNVKIFFIASGISFVSVFLASCYTIGILVLSVFLNTNTYLYEINNMFILLLISALSGAVYLFFLFAPTIIMTVKKGFVWGSVTFGLTIMWSFLAMILLFEIVFLFLNNTAQPPIVRPLMMSGVKSSAPMIQHTNQ